MRKTLAVLLIVVFVSVTVYVWFPPTYQAIVGYENENHSWLSKPIYGTKLNIKNFLLNLLPWIFFSAYLIMSREQLTKKS